MTFKATSPRLGLPQVEVTMTSTDWAAFLGTTASSPPMMRPGTRLIAFDEIYGESEFILAYGVASLAARDAVRIGAGYATTRTVASIRGAIGVSMSANTSTSALSWFCVRGQVPVNVAAATAINTPLHVTATPGALDDAVVAGDCVVGAHAVTAQSATVDTKPIRQTNGSKFIWVPDFDGLYVGMPVTGTGVGASAVITAIGDGGPMLGGNGPVPAGYIAVDVASTATNAVTGTFAHNSTTVTAMLAYPCVMGTV
jgi:hypothetical protein